MTFQHPDQIWPGPGAHPSEPGPVPAEAMDFHTTPTGIVLAGPAGGLREEAARYLGTTGPIIAQVEHATQLTDMFRTRARARPLAGTAVVHITEPFLPGIATRLWRRHRARVLSAEYSLLASALRGLAADRLIVCSTAFLYADDGGRPLLPSSSIEPGPETVAAHAAEGAARLFTSLGGQSVILRLGWVFGDHDPITARVVSVAQKGWQLIDGQPNSWVAAVASADAATAIHAATAAPPGIYNISDGRPVTQGAINAVLEEATGTLLHPLHDASWGEPGTLFGASRLLADSHFSQFTGWRPTSPDLRRHLTAVTNPIALYDRN
jgi:nucleoside-diphosphate-sugar epimerase